MKKEDDLWEMMENKKKKYPKAANPETPSEKDLWKLMGQPGDGDKRQTLRQAPELFDEPVQDDTPDVWELMDGGEPEADVWGLMGKNAEESAEASPAKTKKGARKPVKGKRIKKTQTKEKPKRKHRILRGVLGGAAVLFSVLFVLVAVMLLHTTRNDDLWLDLSQIPYRDATILLATDPQTGQTQEYAKLYSTQNRKYISSGDIPLDLKNAFVAIEDKDFYDHRGVSLKRTIYAVFNELKHEITGSYIGGESGRKQGASTIDQQLIKNLTRDDENSNLAGYLRKIREIYRAYKMDYTYDKDAILTAYLNVISFTGNTAGVEAEAQKLFGKSASQLSLAECASLAAITRNPTRFNPVTKPEEHLTRRNYVLQLMLEQGYIDQGSYNAAMAEPLYLNYEGEPDTTHPITDYFTDVVIANAIDELTIQRGITRSEASDLLYNGGLRIFTTVSPQLQQSMEAAMGKANAYPKPGVSVQKLQYNEDGAPLLDEDGVQVEKAETVYPQAAMISLDYSGGICAVVGGLGEKEVSRGFNRATSAVRQVGSTMKPIGPYAVALEKDKITWSTPLLDAPVRKVEDEATGEEKDWPVNATNSYTNKEILVKDAFAKSINTVAVRVGDLAGNRNMYNFVCNSLEISSLTKKDIDSGPLVLGSSTYGITPLEMARAYTIFGSGGKLPTVHSFTSIQSGTGTAWLSVKNTQKQVLSQETAYIVNRLMAEVMKKGGTASGMAVPGDIESVGKTGTTSDHRDHWFIGLTPYYVTASWYGYDENLPLGANSHWNPPVVAWRSMMEKGQQGLPAAQFGTVQGVVQAQYCTVCGYAAGANCPSATGYYKADNLPKQNCPVHG